MRKGLSSESHDRKVLIMENRYYTITKKDLFDLFGRLSASHRVFVPYKKDEKLYFDEFDSKKEDAIALGGIRQSEPVKSFISPPRDKIIGSAPKDKSPIIIAGVKGCDLSSFRLQDFIFLEGDCKDPFYAENRSKTIIIASDCTYAKETCFCLAMDGAPYSRSYFDINLSPVGEGFLVETGSEKGAKLISDFRMFFKPGGERYLMARQANREKVAGLVKDFIAKRGTPDTSRIKGVVKKNYNLTELWKDFSSTCVECGACNLVCPTCHCFLLFDEKSKKETCERYRIWDACLYSTFARVAGGANPRKHLYERLRNRFEKKFDFFPETLNYFACTGCGRCIEACPGDIDLREVLKGLVSGKWNKPPND